MRALLIWLFMALPVFADGERTGAFDYYVLSLSWSPNWCSYEGNAAVQTNAIHITITVGSCMGSGPNSIRATRLFAKQTSVHLRGR